MKKEVQIYSTATCHFCKVAKEYFAAHDIPFVEYNVGTDVERRNEMIELTGRTAVPVIRVGDQVMVGFGEDAFEKIYTAA